MRDISQTLASQTQSPFDRIGDEALNDGAYVLFLEKSKTHEEATAVS